MIHSLDSLEDLSYIYTTWLHRDMLGTACSCNGEEGFPGSVGACAVFDIRLMGKSAECDGEEICTVSSWSVLEGVSYGSKRNDCFLET